MYIYIYIYLHTRDLQKTKKRPVCIRSNLCDVLLANDSGKEICRYMRRSLVPRAKLLVHPPQFGGGFSGGETLYTHLYMRTALEA